MDGGRVGHSWCMCLVSQACDGLGEGDGWYACGTEQIGGGGMSGDAEHFPGARRLIDETRSQRRPGAHLWVGSSQNWLVFLESP